MQLKVFIELRFASNDWAVTQATNTIDNYLLNALVTHLSFEQPKHKLQS